MVPDDSLLACMIRNTKGTYREQLLHDIGSYYSLGIHGIVACLLDWPATLQVLTEELLHVHRHCTCAILLFLPSWYRGIATRKTAGTYRIESSCYMAPANLVLFFLHGIVDCLLAWPATLQIFTERVYHSHP